MTENNGYRTKQRELIEAFFQERKEQHVTAEDILTFLKEQNTPVSRSTVYRYLDQNACPGKNQKIYNRRGQPKLLSVCRNRGFLPYALPF